jgi:hypothetical protein
MTILDITEDVRKRVQDHGRYRYVAEHSGVGYQWLTKFVTGRIQKPGVDKIAKLEQFFYQKRRATDAEDYPHRRASDTPHRRATDIEHNRRATDTPRG